MQLIDKIDITELMDTTSADYYSAHVDYTTVHGAVQ